MFFISLSWSRLTFNLNGKHIFGDYYKVLITSRSLKVSIMLFLATAFIILTLH